MSGKLEIRKTDITNLEVDCIVNAANTYLKHGAGVCGAIFRAAGIYELQAACDAYGSCPTGHAVITPGFKCKAKHIIHAVGPIWDDGKQGEEALLKSCYRESLRLAMEHGCKTIAFPLISSGIYGYPKEQAWKAALAVIRDFQKAHAEYTIDVIMAVVDEEIYQLGLSLANEAKFET